MSEGDWQYQQHPRPKMLAVQYIQVPSIWRRRRLLASGLWHLLFRALGVSRRGAIPAFGVAHALGLWCQEQWRRGPVCPDLRGSSTKMLT